MDNNEIYEFEDRTYIKPEVSRDEQMAFIDNLRNVQAQNNAQIATDTHNLGTDVPSNLGGLTGSEGYFQQRYQTPQVDAVVANLKATAQNSALTQVLNNWQAQMKERYNEAYRNYQKRAHDYSRRMTSGGRGSGGTVDTTTTLDVDTNSDNTDEIEVNENTQTVGPGHVNVDSGGTTYYTTENGEKWTLRNLGAGDEFALGSYDLTHAYPDGTKLTNGATYYKNGRMFIYIQNSQYPQGAFFRVGDTPTMSYK